MKNTGSDSRTILVTGAAGFIGAALCERIIRDMERGAIKGARIIAVDEMNDYYDTALKEARLEGLHRSAAKGSFVFIEKSISDREAAEAVFREYHPDIVVNLAAHAGVLYSIDDPYAFMDSNVTGFFNILECCRNYPVEHLVYASSASVYGANEKEPYAEDDMTDSPVSLYAATKKCDELLAFAYSKLFGIPATGLRFFTVYGPAGRPDMAYYIFADRLAHGESIDLYNYGDCRRDFTYIDDIVEGVMRVARSAPSAGEGAGGAPHRIYNIGSGRTTGLMDFVQVLAGELKRAEVLAEDFDLESHICLKPLQPGDVPVTCADISGLENDLGFVPETDIRDGLRRFCEWYAEYGGYMKK